MTSRRDFLKYSSLLSAATLMPGFLCSMEGSQLSANGKKLLIIQLSGGCDGLNTVIPFAQDDYYRARPGLGISAGEVLNLNDQQGLNPALAALRPIYDQGQLTILNSVGYPNPDRSHFRSMDIWHTASNSDEYWSHGWLGRYLDADCAGCADPHKVLEIDDSLSLAVKGEVRHALAVSNPQRLYQATKDPYLQKLVETHGSPSEGNDLDFMYKTMTQTMSSAEYVYDQSKIYRSTGDYPAHAFGKQMKQVAELIISGTSTEVYYVSLSGFDTHARQKPTQDRLFKIYGEAVQAFVKDMEKNGLMDEVLVMTFSEFGRRVAQNASGGTDHGKANNVFLIGGNLKTPGFYNQMPDLSKLDDGDVNWEIDFRQIYASLLNDWLGVDDQAILKRKFKKLALV